MKIAPICVIIALCWLSLVGCQSAPAVAPTAAVTAETITRQWLDGQGKQAVKLTKVVTGNPKNFKADGLWCVETNGQAATGLPLLLRTSRAGEKWTTAELEGQYEWDLIGCGK